MKREKRLSDICVICGLRPSTTEDHIPPDGMFPKPRPTDPIKIPTCSICNTGSSNQDRIFQVFVGIAAGHGEEGERLHKNHVTRIVQSDRKLKRSIESTLRDVELHTPSGIILGRAQAVLLDSESYDAVIERIVRGLHFYHTGHILGDKSDVTIYWHRALTEKIINMVISWATGSVGGDQFIYKYVTFTEEPYGSVWVLQFFGSTWSSARVLPRNGK